MNAERKWPGNMSVYVQLWAGSSPNLVTVRNLKEGFKELELGFYTGVTPRVSLRHIPKLSVRMSGMHTLK